MSKKKTRKRIKVKGHYLRVRQRSTKKGKKGTIMGKWKPKREPSLETKVKELVFGKTKKKKSKR
jgi:hypothetical protein